MRKLFIILCILAIPIAAFAAYYGHYENDGDWRGDGTQSVRELVRLQTTLKRIDNKLRVSASSYFLDIAEGHIPDHFAITKFGHNDAVGGSLEEIWSGSTTYYWLPSATTLWVNGGANDDAGGTGALTVQLQGLDANYELISDTVTMDGTNPVETAVSFIRVFRGIVLTAGSANTNVGDIEVYDDAISTNLVLQIDGGYGQTLMAIWTVPADKTAYITKFYSSSDGSRATESNLFVRPFGGAWNVKHNVHHLDGFYTHSFDIPISVGEKSDIVIRSMAELPGGPMSAGFTAWYE